MNILRSRWHREQFEPSWLGLLINPFYFARKGLFQGLRVHFARLSGNVLDVGCGRKPYRAYVAAARYVGVDIDTPITRELGAADVFFNGYKLPFPNADFDGVLCSQVLEHVFTPDILLQEILRVLRPGGFLLLTVPFAWDEHEQPADFARYSSFGIKAVLERNGFIIISQEKMISDFRAVGQIASAWVFKTTRTSNQILNLITQVVFIAPLNIVTLALSKILPENVDFYLDNIVLARAGSK